MQFKEGDVLVFDPDSKGPHKHWYSDPDQWTSIRILDDISFSDTSGDEVVAAVEITTPTSIFLGSVYINYWKLKEKKTRKSGFSKFIKKIEG